jgi:hypothetical protein
MSKRYTVGKPSLKRTVIDGLRFRPNRRALNSSPALDSSQLAVLDALRRDGYAMLPGYISEDVLRTLRSEFQQSLTELKFLDIPVLAPGKVDPGKHPPIEDLMLRDPKEIREMGLAIERSDCSSYEQAIKDHGPGELNVEMLQYSETFRSIWLDPHLLSIVSHYMGLVPRMKGAYVRRSFPSPVPISNNYWHRDCTDHKIYLLKIFFFLTDCTKETGPHDYIKGSITDKRKRKLLNGKRYYQDDEVNRLYPEGSTDRITSIVPAGTVLIEDTRGLHRAHSLTGGYRDLGYAIFQPMTKDKPSGYVFPRSAFEQLTSFQKMFVPEASLV